MSKLVEIRNKDKDIKIASALYITLEDDQILIHEDNLNPKFSGVRVNHNEIKPLIKVLQDLIK